MESSDPSFTQTELDQALAEQAYGLKGYKVTKRTPLESTAEVATLEGVTFDVSLTSRGYQLHRAGSHEEGLVYESVEDLLQVVSPLYLQAKQRLLVERLSSIAFQATELRQE